MSHTCPETQPGTHKADTQARAAWSHPTDCAHAKGATAPVNRQSDHAPRTVHAAGAFAAVGSMLGALFRNALFGRPDD
jgi:hypothetical protein